MKARKLTAKPEEIRRTDLKGLKLTDWDKKNMAHTIVFYEKAFPGIIKEVTDQGRKETVPMTKVELAKAMSNPAGVRRIAIPSGLWRALLEQYPALMVDTAQFNQFLKWFPQFDLLRR